jgi:hypothetical protein
MARTFNGTTQYFNCGAAAPLNLSPGAPFGMSCWANVPAMATTPAFALMGRGFDSSAGHTSYFFQLDSTNIWVGSYDGALHEVGAGYTLLVGNWHHIYGDWTGSTWNMYLDGTFFSNGQTTGPTSVASSIQFYIGAADNGSPGNFAACSLADCALWSGPLSSTDIGKLGNNSGSLTAVRANNSTITSATLRGYWPLNQASGNEPDQSGNHNDGVAVAAPGFTSDPPALQAFSGGAISPIMLATLKRRFVRR